MKSQLSILCRVLQERSWTRVMVEECLVFPSVSYRITPMQVRNPLNASPPASLARRHLNRAHISSQPRPAIATPNTMTSRRIISNEKSILEKDDSDARTPAASAKSDIAPAVPA